MYWDKLKYLCKAVTLEEYFQVNDSNRTDIMA